MCRFSTLFVIVLLFCSLSSPGHSGRLAPVNYLPALSLFNSALKQYGDCDAIGTSMSHMVSLAHFNGTPLSPSYGIKPASHSSISASHRHLLRSYKKGRFVEHPAESSSSVPESSNIPARSFNFLQPFLPLRILESAADVVNNGRPGEI